jgi:hypothetical protein
MRSRFAMATLAGVALCACATSAARHGRADRSPAPVASTADLLAAMRQRYDGRWYRTFTFVQQSTTYRPDGTTERETWLEAASVPGRLRIDVGPREGGTGVIYARDSVFVVRADSVTRAAPGLNALLLLGFDVYAAAPAKIEAGLRGLGFETGRFREDEWDGRPMYVVGAEPGDLHTRQFWVEKDRLLFVRMLEPDRRDPTRTSEMRFNKYRPLGGRWIAPEVEFLVDGKRVFLEEYEEVRADLPLDEALFDPHQWRTAPHWKAR